jgi:hypothetical protein
MRSMYGLFAVVVIFGLASLAAGGGPCWGDQVGCAGCGGYSAPACAAPAYGLAPGCCELPPSCCDHVWDGYCQERARWLYGRGTCWLSGGCSLGSNFCNAAGYCWGGTTCGGIEPGYDASQSAPDVVAEPPVAEPPVAPAPKAAPPAK